MKILVAILEIGGTNPVKFRIKASESMHNIFKLSADEPSLKLK